MSDPVIVLIEDEPQIRRFLRATLGSQGYRLYEAPTGADGLVEVASRQPDVVIVDLGLPDMDGLEVCRSLRQQGVHVPVLMLTARDAVQMRIAGLDSGADDYLTKPFAFQELLARIHAIMRRGSRPITDDDLVVGDLYLDPRARHARFHGHTLPLTAREYALLEYLVRNAGAVVSRGDISERVWNEPYDPLSNVIDVYIQRLRRKLEAAGVPPLIETRRGEGYQLAAPTQSRP
jgi:two-component system copper resistance phosphate regulon response regulator CusR